jgi:hypothetical protein
MIMQEIKDFDILAGTSINEAIKEARRIASINNCCVRFDFNSVEMKIYGFEEIKDMVDYYYRRLKENQNG